MVDVSFRMKSWVYNGRRRYEIGDALTLERDPGNEHDEWAVWVLDEDGRRLGHVDRRYSRQVAEALEAGEELVGLVMSEYDPDDPEPPEVWVKTAPGPATGFWANHVGLAVALVLLALAAAAWLAVSSCVRGILA